MIKKLFNFFKNNTNKECIPVKLPYEVYDDFINSDKSFNDLDKETQQIIYNYIGIQCSPMVSNSCNVRVTFEDLNRHVNREINIFVLQEHLNYPTKNSPEKIRLGGIVWVLNKETLKYGME